ncbi:hypothetical protein PM082_009118 [Marasmius tenuissimus]|nr:hypothetical protein PM082_009118 [Marasmius tenuissimus]
MLSSYTTSFAPTDRDAQVTRTQDIDNRICKSKTESEGKRRNGRSSGLREGSRIKRIGLFESVAYVGSVQQRERKSRMFTEASGMGTRLIMIDVRLGNIHSKHFVCFDSRVAGGGCKPSELNSIYLLVWIAILNGRQRLRAAHRYEDDFPRPMFSQPTDLLTKTSTPLITATFPDAKTSADTYPLFNLKPMYSVIYTKHTGRTLTSGKTIPAQKSRTTSQFCRSWKIETPMLRARYL